jgi:hypothetical protein
MFGLSSLVHRAAQQDLSMIDDLRGRLSKCRVGVVAESEDTGIEDLLGEEIFQPDLRLRACPGREGVAAEAVDGHDSSTLYCLLCSRHSS